MNKNIAFLGILLVAIVGSLGLLLGINVYAGRNTSRLVAECPSSFAQPQTLQNKCLISVMKNAGSMVVQATTDLQAGKLRWTLLDPKGEIAWQSEATAGREVQTAKRFDLPSKGQWTLVIDAEKAQGDYLFQATIDSE